MFAAIIGKGKLVLLIFCLLSSMPMNSFLEIEEWEDTGNEVFEDEGESADHESADEDSDHQEAGQGEDLNESTAGDILPDDTASDSDSSSDIIENDPLPAEPSDTNAEPSLPDTNGVCEVEDALGFRECLTQEKDIRLTLLSDVSVNAADLPNADTEFLSIDLNGHQLTIVIDEESNFTPLRCSSFQLISASEHAGMLSVKAASSMSAPFLAVSSYAFFAGSEAGIQIYSQSADEQAYTMIDLIGDAEMNAQNSRFMTNTGDVLTLITREGNKLPQTAWIEFANIDQHAEFLNQQILYYYLPASPFLYAESDKYQVQIEWGDLSYSYDGDRMSWQGNDNLNNHIRVNNYSLFPVMITHELQLDDGNIKGDVYKTAGSKSDGSDEYDYDMCELAAYEEELIAAASNLPTQLDLYVVLSGSPDLDQYKHQKQIGSLSLTVTSMENEPQNLNEPAEAFDLTIEKGETLILSGEHVMNGNIYRVSGGGTLCFDQFQAVDALDGDVLAECDEDSSLMAGSHQDLNAYRFIDLQGEETTAGTPAVKLIYRKEEADVKANDTNETADEQPQ